MPDNWYMVPSIGSNTAKDPRRPKYADRFEGFSGAVSEKNGRFIVRFFGEKGAHDKTENESDAVSIPQKAASRLNNKTGKDHSIEYWETKHFVNEE